LVFRSQEVSFHLGDDHLENTNNAQILFTSSVLGNLFSLL
jgi:hypothetical protein